MREAPQQVAEDQATGHFGLARFLRQVGLNVFFLLPMGCGCGGVGPDGQPAAGADAAIEADCGVVSLGGGVVSG